MMTAQDIDPGKGLDPGTDLDIEICAREPIHRPGSIQPHGALLVLDPGDLTVLQASRNACSILHEAVRPGQPLGGDAGALMDDLRAWLGTEDGFHQQVVTVGGASLHAVTHRSGAALIVEFEPLPLSERRSMERLFPRLKGFAEKLSAASEIKDLSALTAAHVRGLTGFDRVLVYRFDPEWNGQVIGEDGNGVLPGYQGLRFPASDIPAQARALYKLNRLRIIPNVDYTPVDIEPAAHPVSGEPLDLSFALLRSVSPVHLEYMRNMGTASSMSVSIMVDGELWGLVSCHSRDPHHVSLTVRDICDLGVQAFATEVAARERSADAAMRVRLSGIQGRLLSQMAAAPDWKTGLIGSQADLLAQVDADGAAIVSEDFAHTVGAAPGLDEVRAIVAWLESRGETDLFVTDNLASLMPGGDAFCATASGLMAVRISELFPSWLLWFRPEVVRTVEWAGEPHKVVREQGRIHPRHSFASWTQQVHCQARRWSRPEVGAAGDLRAAIIGVVLRRAEELAQLSGELQRSNKELEAFSYSVSHDLRAPFRHVVGYSELLRERAAENLDETSQHYLACIIDSATAAGRLVDDLLNFSHIGRASVAMRGVDTNKLVDEVRQSIVLQAPGRAIAWEVGPLPPAWGDPVLLRQVWYNLLENAVKYTRPREMATIGVTGGVQEDGSVLYTVTDNGVGFDMRYVDKMFGVFQRLQRAEDFEGTGIGLALARRIVERHNGRIWAEGAVGEGARFFVSLPARPMEPAHG